MDPSLISRGILIGALGAMITPQALAGPIFTYAGKTVRWPLQTGSAPLNVFIDASASSLSASISEALTEWSSVSDSLLQLTVTGSQSAAQIVIGVGDLSNGFSAGYATPSFTTSGELVNCTVTLGANTLTASSDRARMLILHEVGHCLGLVHSTVRHAVMSYRDPSSHLTDDDRLALLRLYPSDGSQDLPLGCATIERAKPPSDLSPPQAPAPRASNPGRFLGLLGLFALAWWRTHPHSKTNKKTLQTT